MRQVCATTGLSASKRVKAPLPSRTDVPSLCRRTPRAVDKTYSSFRSLLGVSFARDDSGAFLQFCGLDRLMSFAQERGPILQSGGVAEVALTTAAALTLTSKHQVEMPITEQMDGVLHHGKCGSD